MSDFDPHKFSEQSDCAAETRVDVPLTHAFFLSSAGMQGRNQRLLGGRGTAKLAP